MITAMTLIQANHFCSCWLLSWNHIQMTLITNQTAKIQKKVWNIVTTSFNSLQEAMNENWNWLMIAVHWLLYIFYFRRILYWNNRWKDAECRLFDTFIKSAVVVDRLAFIASPLEQVCGARPGPVRLVWHYSWQWSWSYWCKSCQWPQCPGQ